MLFHLFRKYLKLLKHIRLKGVFILKTNSMGKFNGYLNLSYLVLTFRTNCFIWNTIWNSWNAL